MKFKTILRLLLFIWPHVKTFVENCWFFQKRMYYMKYYVAINKIQTCDVRCVREYYIVKKNSTIR